MRVEYRRLSLRPYPGEIKLFHRLEHLRVYYESKTGNKYEYRDERTGGRYIRLEGRDSSDLVYLVYARKPHVRAHEFAHVILQIFEDCGIDPVSSKGEPFCYMLSQLMLESAG